MRYHYDVVLPAGKGEADVRSVLEQIGATWAQEIPAGELQLYEQIWRLPGGRGAVRYVYDHFVGIPTVRAESDISGEPGEILFELERSLPFLDIPDLVKGARSTDKAERSYSLRGLAAIAEELYGDIFNAIATALNDPDPEMRSLALLCISRWPHYRFAERLESLAATETVPELKDEAIRLAAEVRAHGRRGTL